MYKFVNRIPLNESNSEIEVNFLEYWETDPKGKVQHFAWITAIPLTKETAELVMRGGRARWRIENETFNTLKNQGYNFEHNYGHGYKNLCTVMGMLMMMAFLIDQVSELCDAAFSKAKQAAGSYCNLWDNMRAALTYLEIANSEDLLNKIVIHNTPRTNTS